MRKAYPSDKLLDFLEALLKRFGKNIPDVAKKLVISSFERPMNISAVARKWYRKEGSPADITPVAKIEFRGNNDLDLLVRCTETFDRCKLVYKEIVLQDQVQMLIASFWIFEGLEGMPALATAKEAIRDWKELILHELVTWIQKEQKESIFGLETVAPLLANLLKLDRCCNPEDADEQRYSRRHTIVEYVYITTVAYNIDHLTKGVDRYRIIVKAFLADLIQLDKKLVETRMLKPALESTLSNRDKWARELWVARNLVLIGFKVEYVIEVITRSACQL